MSTAQTQPASPGQVSPMPVFETAFSFIQTRVLATAIDLDLFTPIKHGARTVETLSANTGYPVRGVRILLNALVAMRYLEKDGDQYSLTPLAATFLTKDSPQYLGEYVTVIYDHPRMRRSWDSVSEVVRTGRLPHGAESAADESEFFTQLVNPLYVAGRPAADVAARTLCDGRPQGLRVLDIGAGSGVWSLAIARHDPQAHVTVVDSPEVIEKSTKRFARREAVGDRYEYLPGDFRQLDFGELQYDVALLAHICHGEGARSTKALFARIHRALKPGGQLLIAELIPDDERKTALMPLIFAVLMLANTEEGDTYTLHEYREWLQAAGFHDVHVIEAPAPSPLIVAKKA
jgi:2-polyprenyl-3-methyl-5-hydroxy-6-metoxy-1,4-benzoquinol methylase